MHSQGISNESLLALRDKSPMITYLNVSFCRKITDSGLGRLTDRASSLETLSLWGCTQISPRFLQGHQLPFLTIIGHPLLTGLNLKF